MNDCGVVVGPRGMRIVGFESVARGQEGRALLDESRASARTRTRWG